MSIFSIAEFTRNVLVALAIAGLVSGARAQDSSGSGSSPRSGAAGAAVMGDIAQQPVPWTAEQLANRIFAYRQIGAAQRAGDQADLARLWGIINSNPDMFGKTQAVRNSGGPVPVGSNGNPATTQARSPMKVGGGAPNPNIVPVQTAVSPLVDPLPPRGASGSSGAVASSSANGGSTPPVGAEPPGTSRPPGNLLNGGKSSFAEPPPGIVSSDVTSGLAKAGGFLTAANVGVDLYEGKKTKGDIASDLAIGVAKGTAWTTAGGLVGAGIGFLTGGPPGAALGFEIGSAGTAAVLTTQGAVETGERISQLVADQNVKNEIEGAFTPNSWIDLPPLPGSAAEIDQIADRSGSKGGWIDLPPLPGSPAARDAAPKNPGVSVDSLLGPTPPRDPSSQWPVCPKCGKRHDPNE
jgi:hypothetical protein